MKLIVKAIDAIFYDDENKPIEIDSATLGILEKETEAYLKFIETPEKFERYEFLISKDYYWYKNLEYVSDKISYETVENAEYTSLVVKNNSVILLTSGELLILSKKPSIVSTRLFIFKHIFI